MASPSMIAKLIVKPGDSHDLDGVMAVMEAAFGDRFGEAWTRSQCAGILPMAGVALTLARLTPDEAPDAPDAPIAGFSLARAVAGESELLLIAVSPDQHRTGIGTALLEDFLARARAAGVTRVHLEVRDGNAATRMYRAAGFAPVGRRRNYYRAADGQRFDALTFAKTL